MSNTIYKKNYLKQVIFRIDFDDIQLGALNNLSSNIEKKFPIRKQETSFEETLAFDSKTGNMTQSKKQYVSWIFENTAKSKQLKISKNHIFLLYEKKYKDSSEIVLDIAIISELIEQLSIDTLTRIGLRYENVIDEKSFSLEDFQKYINKDLVANLNFINNKKTARIMSSLHFKEDNCDIRFNYGFWNAYYPNPIIDHEFVLDYDCFSTLPMSSSETDILSTFKTYNKLINNLFEDSITTTFRKILSKSK